MINNLDIEPKYFMNNDLKGRKDIQQYLIYVIVKNAVYHMLFLAI